MVEKRAALSRFWGSPFLLFRDTHEATDAVWPLFEGLVSGAGEGGALWGVCVCVCARAASEGPLWKGPGGIGVQGLAFHPGAPVHFPSLTLEGPGKRQGSSGPGWLL